MNSFERFGITHLSPSSLNKWRAAPGWWVDHYITGNKEPPNAKMACGTAVETGLAIFMQKGMLGDAIAAAHMTYIQNVEMDDEAEAQRHVIEPMLRVAAGWAPPSPLNATQLRVEHWLTNIVVPVIGYLDFAFDGIDVDLKTTGACPSKPRPDHIRQVSLYRAARGRRGGLLYVTEKKHAFYEVSDEMRDAALRSLRADALALNNFLARCDSKEDAKRSLPLDWDSFYAPKIKEMTI